MVTDDECLLPRIRTMYSDTFSKALPLSPCAFLVTVVMALQLSYDEARSMMHCEPDKFKNLVQARYNFDLSA